MLNICLVGASDVMEHFAFPGNIDFAADYQGAYNRVFKLLQSTHRHNKWLQILAQEDLLPKLLWSENANFKFSVNNEGEDVNKKPRSRRNIAFWSFLA